MQRKILVTSVALVASLLSVAAQSAVVTRAGFTTGGAADPVFNALINTFRADLGGVLNPPGACAPTPCLSGRREVNWDAVPDAASTPNPFPGNFFNGTVGVQPAGRLRGMNMTTPGTGFAVSADEFASTGFGPAEFAVFSPLRLFASLGSPITDVSFAVPGSPGVAATVSGFGAVFTDVDFTGSASMEFFDAVGASMGVFDVPGAFASATAGVNSQGSFSFLGVSFNAGERVSRVRIVSGTHGIDGSFVGLDDAVVMDDFIFAEPLALAGRIPEPSGMALVGLALAALGLTRRRMRA